VAASGTTIPSRTVQIIAAAQDVARAACSTIASNAASRAECEPISNAGSVKSRSGRTGIFRFIGHFRRAA
jgi:hypothetical protein